MRFRTGIVNVVTFRRIIQTVGKIQKKVVMRLGQSEVRIICNSDEGGVQVWSTIRVLALFEDYRVESKSGNEIALLLDTDALEQVLHSAPGNEEVVMKLAKKNDVCVLNFQIFGNSRMGRRLTVSHDVRTEVLRPGELERLKEPMCPEPDVHTLLPPLGKMRTIAEKLRGITDIVAVHANHSGQFSFSAATESIKVEVEWENLTNPVIGENDPSQEAEERAPVDKQRMFAVLLRTRSLLKFLNAHTVSNTQTIACICNRHCMIFYVYIGEAADSGGVLTFYLPAVLDD
ncbi:cell cycle checkpoint [Vararia minispora EC-137]|uniref:Cell cycle checkpoint n=1 Tax=Vararia minispora EC-137 TaxID=1314806 RepID=A0ACB8QHM3_9AGAM|nr:cell cycle checkpoint [Vararia minispora EC-137]